MAEYPPALLKKAEDEIHSPELLFDISTEIGKNHVGDVKGRMLAFLCSGTTLLKPENRLSFRVCGDSTGGKDNMIKSVLDLFPPDCFARYTGTSDKFLARLVEQRPGLYVGELNLQRKGGANQNIIEILKACEEGGISYGYLEPDEKGKQLSVENKVERKVVIHSGTEIGQNDELSNRELSIAVEGSEEQTIKVLERLAEPEDEFDYDNVSDSWVPVAISQLDTDVKVVIPAHIKKYLASIADKKNLRARRDIKRLFCLIRSCAFLHQKQRIRAEKTIYADMRDVYHVLVALGDVLNQSYKSVEPRLEKVIDVIKKHAEESWIRQQKIAEEVGIKGHNRQADVFRTLEDLLVIRRRPDPDDKRYSEIQLTFHFPGAFIEGTPLQICKTMGAISKKVATDSGKMAPEWLLMFPDASFAIDFETGKRVEIMETDTGGDIGSYSTKGEKLSGDNQEILLKVTDSENEGIVPENNKEGVERCS